MVFRDENIIVIEVGSLTTRAVIGLAESMTPPQVRVATKIGIKRGPPQNGQPQQSEYMFGDDLEEAIKRKDPNLEVIQPIVQGLIRDWDAIEIFWSAERRISFLILGDGSSLQS
jgi:actin-related protein 9